MLSDTLLICLHVIETRKIWRKLWSMHQRVLPSKCTLFRESFMVHINICQLVTIRLINAQLVVPFSISCIYLSFLIVEDFHSYSTHCKLQKCMNLIGLTCDKAPKPSVIVDDIIFSFPQCSNFNGTPEKNIFCFQIFLHPEIKLITKLFLGSHSQKSHSKQLQLQCQRTYKYEII